MAAGVEENWVEKFRPIFVDFLNNSAVFAANLHFLNAGKLTFARNMNSLLCVTKLHVHQGHSRWVIWLKTNLIFKYCKTNAAFSVFVLFCFCFCFLFHMFLLKIFLFLDGGGVIFFWSFNGGGSQKYCRGTFGYIYDPVFKRTTHKIHECVMRKKSKKKLDPTLFERKTPSQASA